MDDSDYELRLDVGIYLAWMGSLKCTCDSKQDGFARRRDVITTIENESSR